MPVLWNQTQQTKMLGQLKVADNMPSRMKGLLGTSGLTSEEGLWIHACNSVHTFFMKYAIDCVFLDKNMKVKSIVREVKPGRIVLPRWGAISVVEMAAGRAHELNVKVGDQLNVGT